jgi:hypothetical protein
LKDLRNAGEQRLDSRWSEEFAAMKSRHSSGKFLIKERRARPIGILADLSQMEGTDWKARRDEMRSLQKYTDDIARMAVVGADKWEEAVAMLIAGTAVLQAETRYFTNAEIGAAWDWVRTSKTADRVPV